MDLEGQRSRRATAAKSRVLLRIQKRWVFFHQNKNMSREKSIVFGIYNLHNFGGKDYVQTHFL